METGDWILDTRYWSKIPSSAGILDIGRWLLGTIAHGFDKCGPPISDFRLQNADFMFWGDYNKGF